MKINSQLKKLVRDLSQDKEQIKKINKYLLEIILRWYSPDERIHRDTIYFVRSLKDFFQEFISSENNINNHINSLNYLYSICEVEIFSNSLHDTMICYLEYSNEIGYEPLGEYFNNYKYIRSFLSEMKTIECEINAE